MTDRPRTVLLALASVGMALSALPHAFGAWPHFRQTLETAGVEPRASGAIGAAWAFGTVMMLVCAAVVAGQARRAARGDPLVASALRPIGLGWLGYGLAAFALRDFNTHYLGFVACGAAVSVALVLPARR